MITPFLAGTSQRPDMTAFMPSYQGFLLFFPEQPQKIWSS
jgi:hypothetical protein